MPNCVQVKRFFVDIPNSSLIVSVESGKGSFLGGSSFQFREGWFRRMVASICDSQWPDAPRHHRAPGLRYADQALNLPAAGLEVADLMTNQVEGLDDFHEAICLRENRQVVKVVFF
jgi:hypothetical protein